jgi:cytochrome c-type biogenesis protein CcmH/NrfG
MADEIADIYQHLEKDPRNVALNLQYAAAAEKAGKLKWALPAYERALSADPGNREAKSGIARITEKLRAEADRP